MNIEQYECLLDKCKITSDEADFVSRNAKKLLIKSVNKRLANVFRKGYNC